MGLFSHSVTRVGTSVQRVIEDNAVPDSIRNGAIRAMFSENEKDQTTNFIMEELVTNVGMKASRMLEYGRTGYVYGLPSSSIHSSFAGKDATQAALDAAEGGRVQLNYYHFGALNLLHFGWATLVNSYAYDYASNELHTLSAAKKTPVYLKDMVVVVKEATDIELENDSLAIWGVPANGGFTPEKTMQASMGQLAKPSTYVIDPSTSADHIQVDYCWVEKENATVDGVQITRDVVRSDRMTFPIAGFDSEGSYHQARYITGAGAAKYWIYKQGAGEHLEIDKVFDVVYDADGGAFFPWAYFRFDKTSMGKFPSSPEYKSSEKLVRYLNMDYAALVEGINANPDIADVEQAMMVMAVPAKTSNPMEQRYLFDFFNGIYDKTKELENFPNLSHTEGFMQMVDVLYDQNIRTAIIIQDRRFKMGLTYWSIVKKRAAGNLGKVGTHASGVEGNIHWYKRQVSATMVEEIRVTGLKMTYYVWGDYTTVGDENNENILLIPLDSDITKHYSIPEREELYARSMHYVFNSRVVKHLKWYETGLFRAVLVIIAIIITIYSWGKTWQSISAALAVGALTFEMILMIILTGVLKYLLISFLVRLFIRLVGIKIAFLVAIVAALYGGYSAFEAGSLEGAPWAEEMLQISSSITQGIDKQLKNDFNNLLDEQKEFESYVKEKEEKLESTSKLLEMDNYAVPLIIFGESPTDFYQRTVHSGNIGALSLDAVSSYVDIALTLPKLSTTVGEPYA